MENIAIIAITKNGVEIAKSLKSRFSQWEIFVPSKMSNNDSKINWFEDSTAS
jgi:cobalt-precorrin 5A hydrolase